MQFASDGYLITGAPLTLTGPTSIIQVGDSSVAGAGFTATIGAELAGTTQLVKTDAGTLVLTGATTYTDVPAINGCTLQIAAHANLGATAGGISRSAVQRVGTSCVRKCRSQWSPYPSKKTI